MSSTNARPKRNPRRAAANKQWSEEHLMTSPKSRLKLLRHPEAWTCLEESEKEEILKLLPDNAHPNPYPQAGDPDAKIPPPPESFLRYSNNWRDGIRQFQLDLQHGRYHPEWQRQAEKAVEERAAGKFDRFKEEEFEEFWGQKQKVDRRLVAGQSSQVKLKMLTDHGVICEGDILKYSRVFSTGNQKVLVEKEARIVKIESADLTVAVPPGQRVFLSSAPDSAIGSMSPINGENSKVDTETTEANERQRAGGTNTGSELKAEKTEAISHHKRASDSELPDSKRQRLESPNTNATDNLGLNNMEDQTPTESSLSEGKPQCSESQTSTTNGNLDPKDMEIQAFTDQPPPKPDSNQDSPNPTAALPTDHAQDAKEIIVSNIQGLNALASKIIEIDGRIKKVPNGNAWKEFRAHRNNQDIGSLWEVRQAWFVRENKKGTST
ncbi:uncharacterized protein BO72DRAFT_445993 [Aspergillus fijiensis CBS 313.89]|uniref:DEUBAD domain-containing protein n=1 Tax=Aspergillus fijiensis CBS 313.89 TaxID=1448319 RepID=A0A8G1RXP4_9EURO|nr:uncharacterized protein BO72DRAFT_445993 [Aspergillus fijiensis CBS 313.89]RAK79690.1 hypothetical protein BO72DRAFT_445993 [Aspergillus fijiensis CBS 313.89]